MSKLSSGFSLARRPGPQPLRALVPLFVFLVASLLAAPPAAAEPPVQVGIQVDTNDECVYMLLNHLDPSHCIPPIPWICSPVFIQFGLAPVHATPVYDDGCRREWAQYLANIILVWPLEEEQDQLGACLDVLINGGPVECFRSKEAMDDAPVRMRLD